MSQKELILKALQSGRMITKLEILSEFGCLNAGGRISELRQDGYDIRPMMVRKNEKRFAQYYLIAPDVRREF